MNRRHALRRDRVDLRRAEIVAGRASRVLALARAGLHGERNQLVDNINEVDRTPRTPRAEQRDGNLRDQLVRLGFITPPDDGTPPEGRA